MGQRYEPIERVGCYVPGGKHSLVSSMIMTVVPARVAGVREIVVASPRPTDLILAAAGLVGADRLVPVGGAHAIAALAFGAEPLCEGVDKIVGPGNSFVTAAKHLVSSVVGIDSLAGPSELVVIADESADAGLVAADLLAQAEHGEDSLPFLVALQERLVEAVENAIEVRLRTLPGAAAIRRSFEQGFALLCDASEVVEVCRTLAPEHVSLQGVTVERLAPQIRGFGALFVGGDCAQVFGDYGVGPNHVLPTGGAARFDAGLSVYDFLRPRTWVGAPKSMEASFAADVATLARLEGLEAHARAAEERL